MKAIFVDDEEYLRTGVQTLIDWDAAEVELAAVCANYFEALTALEDVWPDIVITDIKMPVFSGLDLIQKAVALGYETEFIILSGHDEFAFAQTAMKYGVNHYILKPFNEETLLQAIVQCREKLLHKRSQPAALINRLSEKISEEFAQNDKTSIQQALSVLLESEHSAEIITAAFSKTIMHYTRLKALKMEDSAQVLKGLYDCKAVEAVKSKIIGYAALLIQGLPETEDCIEKICRYIDANYFEEYLSLAWLASNLVYMNADYLGKLFFKTTGQKFSKYLTQKRIEAAKQLLITQNDPKIYRIAESVGFGKNPQYFNQIFKEATQMTPLMYAEQSKV